jgi:hypothetical protein
MTIVSDISPISLAQFFYASGKLVRPARLFFYKPNTEDAITVYTEPTLGIAYQQPVLTGGSGRVPPIYIGVDPYKVVVYDSYGSLIEEISYLPGANVPAGGGGGSGPAAGTGLQTGDMFAAFASATTTRTGCVRANGGLLGHPDFDASGYVGQVERAHLDAEALFTWLWGQDGVGALAVIPSKGSTAANDWAQKKAIRLPDFRGRAIVGLDGMGMALSTRISPVPMTPSGQTNAPGAYGGAAFATMTVAQMPLHTHTVQGNYTGITIQGNYTGVTPGGATANLQAGPAGIYITQTSPTGISINAAPTGIYGTDAGHDHAYDKPAPFPGGGFQTAIGDWGMVTIRTGTSPTGVVIHDPWHYHTILDPQHSHGIADPWHTHGQTAHVHPLTDPTHTHNVSDPTHTHGLSSEGGGTAFSTISPFSLAVIYIKL